MLRLILLFACVSSFAFAQGDAKPKPKTTRTHTEVVVEESEAAPADAPKEFSYPEAVVNIKKRAAEMGYENAVQEGFVEAGKPYNVAFQPGKEYYTVVFFKGEPKKGKPIPSIKLNTVGMPDELLLGTTQTNQASVTLDSDKTIVSHLTKIGPLPKRVKNCVGFYSMSCDGYFIVFEK